MITEHTDTTTTTPHKEVRQRYLGDQSRTRHHNPPDTPPAKGATPGCLRHLFLRCSRPLYSSQTTTRTPRTLVAAPPAKGTRPPAGRREPRHNTPTPTRGRGLLSQDPIVRHGPHPPPERSLFHHPHRTNPTGSTTVGQVLGPDPAGNPHTPGSEPGKDRRSAATCSLIFHP
jgi:hypothetical protein